MKPQSELYHALEKVEGIIRDNRLFETLQNASKMVSVISIIQKHSEESNDIAFKRASEDIISMYSDLLDEVVDDLQAIAYAVNTQGNKGICRKEDEMFPNLSAELARRQMTIKSLSQETGINYETLKLKMRGETEFRRIEMQKIKAVFPACSMDYLFASDGIVGDCDSE